MPGLWSHEERNGIGLLFYRFVLLYRIRIFSTTYSAGFHLIPHFAHAQGKIPGNGIFLQVIEMCCLALACLTSATRQNVTGDKE